MSPEFGSTAAMFPVDHRTIGYLRDTGRDADLLQLVESYCQRAGLFRTGEEDAPVFSETIDFDLTRWSRAWPARAAAGSRVAGTRAGELLDRSLSRMATVPSWATANRSRLRRVAADARSCGRRGPGQARLHLGQVRSDRLQDTARPPPPVRPSSPVAWLLHQLQQVRVAAGVQQVGGGPGSWRRWSLATCWRWSARWRRFRQHPPEQTPRPRRAPRPRNGEHQVGGVASAPSSPACAPAATATARGCPASQPPPRSRDTPTQHTQRELMVVSSACRPTSRHGQAVSHPPRRAEVSLMRYGARKRRKGGPSAPANGGGAPPFRSNWR